MKLITRQSRADEAAQRYKSQAVDAYSFTLKPLTDFDERRKRANVATYESLLLLGDKPDPDRIDDIMGNGAWTDTECDECGATGIPVVELGEPLDYESSTAFICLDCLRQAINLIEGGDERIEDTLNRGILRGDILP